MAAAGITCRATTLPSFSNAITHLLMSFIDEQIGPQGASPSSCAYGIGDSRPSINVCGTVRFSDLGISALKATVLLMPSGAKIFSFKKTSQGLPYATGIISPAVKNAALVYPHLVRKGYWRLSIPSRLIISARLKLVL